MPTSTRYKGQGKPDVMSKDAKLAASAEMASRPQLASSSSSRKSKTKKSRWIIESDSSSQDESEAAARPQLASSSSTRKSKTKKARWISESDLSSEDESELDAEPRHSYESTNEKGRRDAGDDDDPFSVDLTGDGVRAASTSATAKPDVEPGVSVTANASGAAAAPTTPTKKSARATASSSSSSASSPSTALETVAVLAASHVFGDHICVEHTRHDVTRVKLMHGSMKAGSVYSLTGIRGLTTRTVQRMEGDYPVTERVLTVTKPVVHCQIKQFEFGLLTADELDFDRRSQLQNGVRDPYPVVSLAGLVVHVDEVVEVNSKTMRSFDVAMRLQGDVLHIQSVTIFGAAATSAHIQINQVVGLVNAALRKYRGITSVVLGDYSLLLALDTTQGAALKAWYEEQAKGSAVSGVAAGFEMA